MKLTLINLLRQFSDTKQMALKMKMATSSLGKIQSVRLLEDHRSGDVYAEIFSDPDTRVSDQTVELLGYTKMDAIHIAVEEYLETSKSNLQCASVLPLSRTPRALAIVVVTASKEGSAPPCPKSDPNVKR